MELIDGHVPKVVVIGSGFGGLYAAKALGKVPVETIMIAKTTHHLFQPLLYQVGTGILSQGEIAPATREIVKHNELTEVLLGDVTEIDLTAKTVTSMVAEYKTVTEYDFLIVAAGATQSYFGNDHFEQFAPGLKTVDDALEVRARIFGSFELAELHHEPEEQTAWLTFVVVGAGPTGVELAGQIRELARHALSHDFRNYDPNDARVILVEGGNAVLSDFGPKQSAWAKKQLEKMGVEVRLDSFVTNLDADTVEITHKDGSIETVAAKCKLWGAGVAASPLTKTLGEQTGAELDGNGRIHVNPDLTLPGHPEVFVVGDMISLDNLPGVAQVAMQGGKYAAEQIKRNVTGDGPKGPFKYFDKGSMATVSRFKAVCNVGKLQLHGFIAWLMWLFIHVMYLVGFQKRVSTLGHWFVAFLGRDRAERTVTTLQAVGTVGMFKPGVSEPAPKPKDAQP